MDVLCVGHAAWDISLFLDGYPAENSKWEIHAMLECGGRTSIPTLSQVRELLHHAG